MFNPLTSIKTTFTNMTIWNWVIIITLFIAGTFSTGCLRSFIKVDTPQNVVETYAFPEKIPLDEVDIAIESYVATVTNNINVWNANKQLSDSKAAFWTDFIAQLTTPETLLQMGINPAGGSAASLLYFLGLITRKPGDVSPTEYRKGKEKSYNAGIEIGAKVITTPKNVVQV